MGFLNRGSGFAEIGEKAVGRAVVMLCFPRLAQGREKGVWIHGGLCALRAGVLVHVEVAAEGKSTACGRQCNSDWLRGRCLEGGIQLGLRREAAEGGFPIQYQRCGEGNVGQAVVVHSF